MATLIQSKQIQGIVTASVIEGDFKVASGSVDLSTSQGVTGSFSGSFVGDGTGLTINYSQLQGKPNFVAGLGINITQVGNDITITNTGGSSGDGGGLSSDALNSIARLNADTGSQLLRIQSLESATASLQSQIDSLNVPTTDISSLNQFTSSVTTRIDDVEQQIVGRIDNIETFTQSIDSRVTALENANDLTGSDSQTLSVNGNQITISGGNTITIPTGSSGTSDFTQLTNVPTGLVSSSDQITLAGIDGFSSYFSSVNNAQITQDARLTSLESFTASLDSIYATDSEVSSLSASIATTIDNIQHTQIPQGTISSSQQISDLGFVTSSGELTLPSGLISSSQQISDLGFRTTDLTGSDSQTLSVVGDQLTISGGNTITIPTGSNVTLPSGLISSSQQITDLGFIDSAHTDVTQLNQFTQSIQSQVDSLTNATSSYLTSLPSGLVSGSVLRTLDGTGVVSGSVLRTLDGTGVLSGSIVTDLSSSLDSRISVLESQIDLTGSDSQTLSIVGDQLTIAGGNTITIPTGSTLPSGLITSSQQISDLGYVTSALEAPFNGDRVVSNTLLGDLYTGGFNAGTSGSLAQFIEQVFFPASAPVATFTNQTSKFNTNLATDGTNLVSVSLTDTVDNSPYTLVLSGTNASSLSAVPTNAESSSWEIRANGNLSAGTYSYDVTVGEDSTNAERTYSGRSITIAQADNGTLLTNGTLYIIESATSGVITLSSSGIPGSTGAVSVSYSPNYGSQVATNFSSSNPLIAVNSTNGQLSLGSPISGSGNEFGSTVVTTISWEDQYGNTDSNSIVVNVTQNNAPNVSQTLVTNNNTNQATGSSQVLRLTITDTEGDTIPNSGLSFSGYNTTYFTPTISTPYMYLNVNNTSIPAGTYPYTASLTDEHGFRTRVVSGSFTINQADTGTLVRSNFYVLENAPSGSPVYTAPGFSGGNPVGDIAQLEVTYNPNYGNQVATFLDNLGAVHKVDSDGYITLKQDNPYSVSTVVALSNKTIAEDQYGNQTVAGQSPTDPSVNTTITFTTFANRAPAATFIDNGLTDVTAVSGSNIGTLTVTDDENNTPFTISLSGTDGDKFDVSGTTSPFSIQPTGSLSIGSYSIQILVQDSVGKQTTLNETISVTADADYGKVYVYTLSGTRIGGLGNYDGYMGITSKDTSTNPDLVTGYQSVGPSPIYALKTGDLGSSSITVGGGTMTLRAERSGSNLDEVISSSFTTGNTAEQIMIIFPSGSDMVGTPTSITDSAGSATGEYVLYLKGQSDSTFGAAATQIHMFDVDTAVEGYTRWNIIGRTTSDADSSFEARLIPSSGSAPS